LLGRWKSPAVAALLDDPPGDLRWPAVQALGAMEGEEAIRLWSGLLLDGDGNVRRTAVAALGRLGARERLADLRLRLRDDDADARAAAAGAVARLGDRSAVPQLIEDLEDSSTAYAAADALATLEAREAIHDLVRVAETSTDTTALAACRALMKLDPSRAEPTLLRLFQSREPYVRDGAANELALLGRAEVIPVIVQQLEPSYRGISVISDRTARTLKRLGAREAVPHLVTLMNRTQFSTTIYHAISLLCRLGAVEALPDIARHLDDGDADTRRWAVWALGELGGDETVARARPMLGDEDSMVRLYAAGALWKLGAPDAPAECLKLLGDESPEVRAWAAELAGQMRAADAVPRLKELLGDATPRVRRSAASALCVLKFRDGAAELLKQSDGSLICLNVLRRPDAVARLREVKITEDLEGPTSEILRRVAEKAGVKLELPDSPEAREMLQVDRWISQRRAGWTLTAVLEMTAAAYPFRFDAIIEDDRIRVVRHEDAVRFWTEWASNP
jgi:HEAT repeat protein